MTQEPPSGQPPVDPGGSAQCPGAPATAHLRHVLLALVVVAPWYLGIATGHQSTGLVASFGAYLIAVSFPLLPAARRNRTLVLSALIFSSFATLGAVVPLGSAAFFACALLAALAQSVFELRGGAYRLPVALAALSFFLSVGQVPAHGALHYGASFLAGTIWTAVFMPALIARAPKAGTAALVTAPVEVDGPAAHRRFTLAMLAAALSGSFTACFAPGSHPCWMPAAGLRIMKPTRSQTLYRMRARGAGTILGAAASGLILGLSPLPWLHATLVFAVLVAMLTIGARKYGAWSFCLTAIALAFDLQPEGSVLLIATDRVMLTLGGIALAAVMIPLLPRQKPAPNGPRPLQGARR